MNQIKTWLISWLEQCLLRRAPQDDPLSSSIMLITLVAYSALDLVQAKFSSGWLVALGMTGLDVLLMLLFAWVVLLVANKMPRFIQTVTALAGTGLLLAVLGTPLVQQASRAHQYDEPMAGLVLAWLLLLIWSISVQAHIFRHALSARYGVGLMVSGLHAVIAISLLEYWFPQTGGS